MTATVEKEQVNDVRIRDLMQRWEIWRDARRKETLAKLGYGESFLKKCLDGMPGTICPLCRGKDEECPVCDGSGKIQLETNNKRINPAFIRSTFYKSGDDKTSEQIDRIICQMRNTPKLLGFYFVLIQEYTRIGRQSDKADRLNLSHGNYRWRLNRAHKLVAVGLGLCKGVE